KLIHADTAYQLVTVKPNTEYTLTFDIAGSIVSPSEVTVGNLNANQKIIPLTKKQYTGFRPEHHEMKFKTGEDVSNFAVKLASTANGRAKFDNVQLKEKEKSYIFNIDFDHNSSLEPFKPSYGSLNYNIEEHAGVNNSKGLHFSSGIGHLKGDVTLKPNTTYILSASGKVSGPEKTLFVGAQSPGGKDTFYMKFTSTQYEQKSVEFTTLNTNNPYSFFLQINGYVIGDAYLDDIVLVEK
ncbi:choline-binding protein A, partial [Bacillus toyonensis]|uniref:choline-binding protein A n=1 Tax=Bacillus toyonensis TaxID=155322 RepID=UPI000BF3543E